jgi:phosphocarrier protein
MGLMMLAAATGCSIHLEACGADARAAVDSIVQLVENKFDED